MTPGECLIEVKKKIHQTEQFLIFVNIFECSKINLWYEAAEDN